MFLGYLIEIFFLMEEDIQYNTLKLIPCKFFHKRKIIFIKFILYNLNIRKKKLKHIQIFFTKYTVEKKT